MYEMPNKRESIEIIKTNITKIFTGIDKKEYDMFIKEMKNMEQEKQETDEEYIMYDNE